MKTTSMFEQQGSGEDQRPTAHEVSMKIERGQLDPSLRDWAMSHTRSELASRLKPATYNGPLEVDVRTGQVKRITPDKRPAQRFQVVPRPMTEGRDKRRLL